MEYLLMKTNNIICPLCDGTGELPCPNDKLISKREANKGRIVLLINEGYSYREIMKIMGWKSTSVVSYYLNK